MQMAMTTEPRVKAAATTMEGVCRRMGLIDTDIGRAILRVKVFGYSAKLGGLNLKLRKDATANEEMFVAGLRAFVRARSKFRNENDHEEAEVKQMETAAQSVQ